jgi:uncharacterized membrane protein
MIRLSRQETKFIQALGFLSLICVGLFLLRVIATGSFRYFFIPGNLALAWLSLFFAWLLVNRLRARRWLSWQNIGLSILWLIFLPNSWYVLTDFIHVQPTGEISQLYDIVLVCSLVVCGFIAGFTSLYIVHLQLRKRLGERVSAEMIAAIILAASFAIYLGRALRWNSWDVIANPSGLILNVSDRLFDPLGYPRSLNITGLFFVMLGSIYWSIWLFLPRPALRKRR